VTGNWTVIQKLDIDPRKLGIDPQSLGIGPEILIIDAGGKRATQQRRRMPQTAASLSRGCAR
jgi:hypothetical protein